MINMESFFEELSFIKESAQKCRSGSMPIRASNLADKDRYDGRGKRTTKLATPRLLMDALSGKAKISPQTLKALGLVGGGTAAGAMGKNEWDKYMLGRRVYDAQNR